MNKKKCLFVAHITGHINAFHIPYLKMFKENGYEVHVASNGKDKIEYCDKHFDLPFERFPIKSKNIEAYKELKKITNENNYEIIHCHTPVGAALTRLAARKARKKGTRVIYTAHGFHFFKGAPLLNWIVYYPIERFLARYTDTLITINEEDYERAKKNFKVKQIELVHGVGIDTSRFNDSVISENEKKNLRKTLGINEKDYVFINVGELNKNKNQIMQIEAMKEVVKLNKNIKLLIVGKGSMRQTLEEFVKKYELQNNVIFAGFRKDIPQLLKISDCLLATSYREGLPVNVMEAMASSLPVIVTNCRGQRDLVNKDDVVEINDVGELVRKIQKNIENKKVKIEYDLKNIELNTIIKKMKKIYQI